MGKNQEELFGGNGGLREILKETMEESISVEGGMTI